MLTSIYVKKLVWTYKMVLEKQETWGTACTKHNWPNQNCTKEKSLITYLKETQAKVAKSTLIVYVTGKTYIQVKIVEPRLILNFLCLLALIHD